MTNESYDINFLRQEIKFFAINMEKEMQKKDELGYTNNDKSIQFLEDKLYEEIDEVYDCLINEETNKFINEESLHAGIMLAILRHRLKEENEQLT